MSSYMIQYSSIIIVFLDFFVFVLRESFSWVLLTDSGFDWFRLLG